LPDGWYRYTDRTGFSVPLPDGVKASGNSSELRFRWNNRLLIIAQTDQPRPDPYVDWQQQERDRAGDQYRNYRKIRLERIDYFQSAADWEFTYTTGNGNAQRAVKRNFLTSDTQAYSINWYTSPGDWDAAKKDIQLIYQGFKPRR
jgi:eukaryotic-like serine/threonine-protein kinase